MRTTKTQRSSTMSKILSTAVVEDIIDATKDMTQALFYAETGMVYNGRSGKIGIHGSAILALAKEVMAARAKKPSKKGPVSSKKGRS